MITTKKGDSGETDCGGNRVNKDNILVETIGEIDEFQAVLELIGGDKEIIKDLGVLMGELGSSNLNIKKTEKFMIYDLRIRQFEEEIKISKEKLSKFIIFKTKKARELNWARTVCRRVERRVVSLSKTQKIDKDILKYFNRLSDYLFMKAIKKN